MLYNINDSLPLTLDEKLAKPQAVLPEWKETATPGLLVHRDTGLMKYSGDGHNQVTEAMCSRKRAPIPQTASVKFSDVVVDKLDGHDTVNNKRFKRGVYAYPDSISWLPDTPPLNPHCAAENAANT